GTPLAAHQTVVALHQFAEHLFDRHAASERMSMAAVGTEAQVLRADRCGEPCRDSLLSERQVASALHQVLQKQVVGTLLGFSDFELSAVQAKPRLLADIVVVT